MVGPVFADAKVVSPTGFAVETRGEAVTATRKRKARESARVSTNDPALKAWEGFIAKNRSAAHRGATCFLAGYAAATAQAREALEKYDGCPHCVEIDRLRALLGEALERLSMISTDCAQDAIEDPVGHAKRADGGFYRIACVSIDKIAALLARIEEETK